MEEKGIKEKDPNMTTQTTSERISIGLWAKKSKKGNPYLSGSFEQYWVNYFNSTDSFFKGDSPPAGTLMLSPKDKNSVLENIKVLMFKSKDKNGKSYLRGTKGKRFTIFSNRYKKTPNQPDFRLYISPIVKDYKTINSPTKDLISEENKLDIEQTPISPEMEQIEEELNTFLENNEDAPF